VAFFHDPQDMEYQAVLCVRPKLCIEFIDEVGNAWPDDQKELKPWWLHNAVHGLTGNYRLVGGTGAVQNIFVNFMAGFHLGPPPVPGWNFHLRYRRDLSILNNCTELESANQVIEIGKDVHSDDIVNALFNRTGGTMLAALDFLKIFADDKLKDRFTLEKI